MILPSEDDVTKAMLQLLSGKRNYMSEDGLGIAVLLQTNMIVSEQIEMIHEAALRRIGIDVTMPLILAILTTGFRLAWRIHDNYASAAGEKQDEH